jgi:hypothetical protein
VAVEGRDANLRKTKLAAKALGLVNLDVRKGDVRELNERDYGKFDAILCLGILYHLDSPDVMELVSSISQVCDGLVVIDTHFSLRPRTAVDWNGHRYWGQFWTEYSAGARAAEEDDALWSSIGNDRSFLLSKASLSNLLRHVGFTSAYETLNPYECHSPDWPSEPRDGEWAEWPDRTTFIAVKGHLERLFSSPVTDEAEERDRPERPKYMRQIPLGLACRIESAKRIASRIARIGRRSSRRKR